MSDHHHDPHQHSHDADHVHEPMGYVDQVEQQRHDKDAWFKQSPHSPIPPGERTDFEGLPYYPVDPSLRFAPLDLGPVPDGVAVEMRVQTSDGAVQDGRVVGSFAFGVDGAEQRLLAMRLAATTDGSVFVPFRDATSGPETYEAGRYLDLDPFDDGTFDLDFNLAYSPFCAYSPSYSCPLPPPQNRLSVSIAAGERNRDVR